ncbi:MAG: hypothetical protein NTW05_29030, partial [Pseudonocardiales bacterium]|nr:hypothetical protein [Pseudonocardiales bacterium]
MRVGDDPQQVRAGGAALHDDLARAARRAGVHRQEPEGDADQLGVPGPEDLGVGPGAGGGGPAVEHHAALHVDQRRGPDAGQPQHRAEHGRETVGADV